MKTGYFLILMVLFGNIFGYQGFAQNPLKLKLNYEETGTSADTSVLIKKLDDVIQNRVDQGFFEKTIHLAADRSVSAEEMAKLFGTINKISASPILLPLEIKNPVVRPKPNPLTLLVYAGTEDSLPFNNGIEIDFIGEISESNNGFPLDKNAIAVAFDKNGAYLMDGKPFSATALKTAITSRLKTKSKNKKIIFVRAENYGNMEDVATIAKSAGAVKIFFVTKNTVYNENGITFSLSPAFIKDKDVQQMEGFTTFNFKRSDSGGFEINLQDELFSKEKADDQLYIEYETRKNDAEVSTPEIDGSLGVFSTSNEDGFYDAKWMGARKKDGKYQLVIIYFSCHDNQEKNVKLCQDRANYSQSEFLQILKSLKFK
ncbi:MAG: hypothetical protein K1X72_01085 [Pyrinomonadaceae bacterium]|nr:hypothetical protein [Pyrinomonadaceae bacterium]